jgi:PEGA domain.
MHIRNGLFIFILFIAVCSGFCEQKAKVLTVTGKKWDVLFIRMHNDTIYLQVPKVNGKTAMVSGHKEKFKKIEFTDGTMLDLSLSNYPAEPEIKLNGDIGDFPGTTSSSSGSQTAAPAPSNGPNAALKSTFIEDSLALNAAASHGQPETRPDSLAGVKSSLDNISQTAVSEKSDSNGGTIVIETKPSFALITLDGKPLEIATPYTIKHLAPGRHGIRVTKDSLSAFTLVTVKKQKTINVNVRLKKEAVVKTLSSTDVKKKGHALAWSLCMSSVVLLASSAASYYFAFEDQKRAQEAKDILDNSSVHGSVYEEQLEINTQKSNAARLETNFSEVLLGAGILDLGLGIVFFF